MRGCRSQSFLLSTTVGLVLVLLLTTLCSLAVADTIETPLCSEKHGFASEFNDHFSIPVETAPAEGEAIILIARAFPANLGSLLERWLLLNASFYLPEGALVSRTSDNNGILELPRVAVGTEIEVRVQRVRPDGPVPFRFFSFFANKPVCHVAVSPDNSFFAPVPHRLGSNSKTVTMYFKTALPPGRNAVAINIVADARAGESYQVLNKDGVWQSHSSNDLIQPSSGNSVSFAFSPTPDDSGTAFCFTAVSVAYANVEGGTAAPNNAPPSGKTGKPSSKPTTLPGGATTNPLAAPSSTSTSMSVLRRLLIMAVLCFLVWQVVHAVYNYHVLGKRDVMEVVPCAETVAAGARGVQLAASRGLGMSNRRSDGYDCLQGMSDPYA
jgi:hypothetical protein